MHPAHRQHDVLDARHHEQNRAWLRDIPAQSHLPHATLLLDQAVCTDGAVPAIAVTDTIKQVDAQNVVVNTPDRSSLVAVQTPQVFRAEVLREAHASCPEGTDDATLVELLGKRVVVVAGEALNRKLTALEDLEWARATARTEV